jgi:hypothetical protein
MNPSGKKSLEIFIQIFICAEGPKEKLKGLLLIYIYIYIYIYIIYIT